MPRLRFHALGDWRSEQVRTKWVAATHAPPPEVRQRIEREWEQALRRPGVHLFDGPMCRLERWAQRGDLLELELSPTSYRMFLGTNMSCPEAADRYGRGVLANPVGVSPALETADGFLLMGRRNAAVAYYPNRIHPFAGSLEPDEAGDVFAAVRRELAEELSLAAHDVPEIRLTGIAEDVALRQPELIFRTRTTLTRAQLEARVAPREHGGSAAIEATAQGVEQWIGDARLTPVGAASILLWGRVVLGEAWWEAQHSRVAND